MQQQYIDKKCVFIFFVVISILAIACQNIVCDVGLNEIVDTCLSLCSNQKVQTVICLFVITEQILVCVYLKYSCEISGLNKLFHS
jgi:hypothetical protein